MSLSMTSLLRTTLPWNRSLRFTCHTLRSATKVSDSARHRVRSWSVWWPHSCSPAGTLAKSCLLSTSCAMRSKLSTLFQTRTPSRWSCDYSYYGWMQYECTHHLTASTSFVQLQLIWRVTKCELTTEYHVLFNIHTTQCIYRNPVQTMLVQLICSPYSYLPGVRARNYQLGSPWRFHPRRCCRCGAPPGRWCVPLPQGVPSHLPHCSRRKCIFHYKSACLPCYPCAINTLAWRFAFALVPSQAREASFRNQRTIAECLADEIVNAANVSHQLHSRSRFPSPTAIYYLFVPFFAGLF